MNCPYCQNQVLPKAYVCGHCGRDLVPFLSLLTEMEGQTKRIERIEKQLGLPPLHEVRGHEGVDRETSFTLDEPPPLTWHWQRLCIVALATTSGLLLAHWLLLFVYDAPPLILRVVTMLVPLLVALGANARGDVDWRSNALMAFLISVVGVGGMLALTSWLDEVPWLPDNKRDWIETFEYTVSVLLAWITGHLIGLALNKGHRMLYEKRRMAMARGSTALPKLNDISEQLQKVAAAAAPVVSGLVAAYSGLKSIMGDGGP